MIKKLRRKTVFLILLTVVSMIILGVSLGFMQTKLSISNYKRDMRIELSKIEELLQTAEKEKTEITETYDAIYRAKADSVAFMANKIKDFEYTNAEMQKCRDLLAVTNVMILDAEGNIVARSGFSKADFTRARFNQLRTVFNTYASAEAFNVSFGKEKYRYYGTYIDGEHMVVVEQDPQELDALLEKSCSDSSVLGKISVGLQGYTFSVSDKNYMIDYHPNKDLIGMSALDMGAAPEFLEDNFFGWMNINGKRVFAGMKHIGDNYYICTVPETEIESTRTITLTVILFVFFAVMIMVILYGVFVMGAEEGITRKERYYKKVGKLTYNKVVGRKATTLSIIGVLCIMLITFYMQTLTAISQRSVSNNQRVDIVEKTMQENQKNVEILTEQYNERYLNKAKIAAGILSLHPELITKETMEELQEILQIREINVFDQSGVLICTSASYSDFRISEDPKAQSYEFNRVLQGAEYLIQKPQKDEVSGQFSQYIGVPLIMEDEINGFVQIGIRPERLENLLKNTEIDKVLDGIQVGAEGFAFALDKKDYSFVYYPDSKMIGRSAEEYGMKPNQFKDDFDDYLTLGKERYFGSSLETDDYLIYVVVPGTEIGEMRIPITLATSLISLICLVCVYLLLTLTKDDTPHETVKNKPMAENIIEVETASGITKSTVAVASRWSEFSVKWDERTPEQKLAVIMKWLMGIMALGICIAFLFRDSIFDKESIYAHILSFQWERGLNIFAVTGSIVVVFMVIFATKIVEKILHQLALTFDARGETVCRLMLSFVKYISGLGMIFYCLSLFGVDTKTLLASAGILSMIVGLGAKDLVADIIAGLFIIFEGEFRVGDIVSVGGYRGVVAEIGVRTTKIEDFGKNVKIINNSAVGDVINMTKQYSFAFCDVGIEYGESLERVENILDKEFPNIRRRLPAIQDGPYYKGVVALADNSVNIRIVTQCHEADRVQLERDLNREMKLIFDKYDINIPFPQVVINQPVEYQKATWAEKANADKFAREQKEMTKELYEEEEEY